MIEFLTSPPGYALLLGWSIFALACTYVVALKFVRTEQASSDDLVRRIARNSIVPIGSQLIIRFVDLFIAIVILRLLGPERNGEYAIAVIVWLYVKTISDFGLALLTTADIARDRAVAGRLIGTTTLLRWLIWLATGIAVFGYLLVGWNRGSLATDSILAIVILYLSVLPSSYTDALNSAFNGFERMEIAAVLNVGVAAIRVGLAVALAGMAGVAGVALAAFIAATFSAQIFHIAARKLNLGRVDWTLRTAEAKSLAGRSWPLFVNGLLVNLFFRIDVFIVQASQGNLELGLYDAAYKLINLVTIIPAYVTLALFPTLAQRVHEPASFGRMFVRGANVLVWIAWGLVIVTLALATQAINVLAGADYLPEAANLLRILIWFAPLSFLNGILQYGLIALELQRRLVPVFIAAVLVNLGLNLVLVPSYGATAAAWATVITEVVILFAFLGVVARYARQTLAPQRMARLWRASIAGAIPAVMVLIARDAYSAWIIASVACAAFITLSLALQVFDADDRRTFATLVRR